MKSTIRAVALAAAFLISSASFAGEAVPINATFGIGWMPVDWTNPADRITESFGAAGLPSGRTFGIATRDHLNVVTNRISSDCVILAFTDTDWVCARYADVPAGYDPATSTASFGGPLEVTGGEGRVLGAAGTLTIRLITGRGPTVSERQRPRTSATGCDHEIHDSLDHSPGEHEGLHRRHREGFG